jgi:ribose transport system substrate-binding protein
LNRRDLLKIAGAGTGAFVLGRYFTGQTLAQVPPLEKKDSYTIGFAQTGSNNPWRLAETASMKDQFETKLGWKLIATDANEDTSKQLTDIDAILAQQPDIFIFPPRETKPLAPVVQKIKAAGIPVILIDRDVDHSIAKPGVDYVTFIGSDFVDQGKRAAEWLVKATNGQAKIIELEGTAGADPAILRKQGFDDYIAGTYKGSPTADGAVTGMQILESRPDGDFQREKGRQIMQTLLQAHPDVTAVYAHNDEMAIGAIQAMKSAGMDMAEVIVGGVDATQDALAAMQAGDLDVTVFQNAAGQGQGALDAALALARGETVEQKVYVPFELVTPANIDQYLSSN